ncbi:MAG TPA: hypothetical protein VFS76_15670 [Pyrinomonadaceae bacterium]|nr:hypothetical protein [Pyrinomonadaceae bacterium]
MANGTVVSTLLQTYSWCVAGIIISIALPILTQLLPRPAAANKQDVPSAWEQAKPFVVVGVFSLLTGLLIVAFTWGTVIDWRAALLAGYAWDSTLQKLKKA